ncbi:hypothetical protein [Halorubrum sp. T3]|uniref:hypothetical protein n=1 Tax=Halorubrum sp. T3 TaxID=1194088 RepID=UPI0012BB0553|nr:hypothetical protein [Halorubrum sp. T3]
MVARENKVFYVFGASALVIFLALVGFTEYPSWVKTAVLFVVGIFVPLLVNDFLDGRES